MQPFRVVAIPTEIAEFVRAQLPHDGAADLRALVRRRSGRVTVAACAPKPLRFCAA
jgi:hypothetical protein